ncbi:putative vitellogenin receptor [Pseudolycoriella hygida]|uniref:Vitellogenin receptor n=1 Tax=Pseudolycoriella hygida TaxID=35572 RepID=A0A9Q0MU65_9DIPT|nr:putative vitellogenin receptor [Pseudolycoriella hygida]
MSRKLICLLMFLSVGLWTKVNVLGSDEHLAPCSDPENFECSSGGVCIKPEFQCDGKKDCLDGSDELEAECDFKLCRSPQYYRCKDKMSCIAHNYRCDGHYDCPLNDDEENCADYVPHHEKVECNADEFSCFADNMCISLDYVCDGVRQCIDGSDEEIGCLNIEKKCNGFVCKNRHCLTDKSWVCDGTDDCGDGSDEKDCVSNCISENKMFLCGDNVTCLSVEKVCDKNRDCVDGLDEGGICDKFSNNRACESNYCPRDAECYIWPTGPVCICPKGFFYNAHQKVCEDIDECQTHGICSQLCTNTPGSYNCSCVPRFRLKNDRKTCESISHTEPTLLYAGKKSINMVYLRSGHETVITEKVRQVIGVSSDGHFIYWTNVALNTESIVKAREDGSKMETLLTTGLSLPEDIAVDWITGNLYFSDAMYMHIAVCSNDGKHCTSLITENVERPRSIALYPQEGRMFWSEWGSKPMIATAHMDGSFSSPFILENIQWPSGITLDWPNNRLYWVDAKLTKIESVNLDGTARRTVLGNVLKHPYGLAVFEDNIYWSDWSAMSIETCNKFTCKGRKTIVRDRKVYDLHIYHNSIQPITENPCKNNKCTHLCLLASNVTHTCGCPNGMTLNIDNVSCSANTTKESIVIGMRNYLIKMEHETFGRHQIDKAKLVPMNVHKLAYNLLNGHIFVADNVAQIIYDFDLTKEVSFELVNKNIGKVTSMAFDHLSNNLYWSDAEHGTIEMLSLNKNQRTTVYNFIDMAKPVSIGIVPENGQMFVASRSIFGHTHIDIQSLHGKGDRRHLVESELGDDEIQFAVDRQISEVFWTDTTRKQISWSDYTGQSLHVFKKTSGAPTSIAVLSDDVFWTKKKSLDVFWTPKHGPETTKQLILPRHDYVSKDDDVVVVAIFPTITSRHPCMVNNGGCSHICATSSSTQMVCLCPPGMVFINYHNNTCIAAIDCEFRCGSGECITSSRRCNNFNDCPDASDEMDCASLQKVDVYCYRDEFKCLDGKQCISIDLRCDKITDCKDKSDETDCVGFNASTKCHKNQFVCSNNLCIDLSAVCDGMDDCEDGGDEVNCHDMEEMKHMCRSNMFTCTTGQCIPAQWVCDEAPDCSDGSDELNCPEKDCPVGYLKCGHGQCVDRKLICDGFDNCGDNTDELNCTEAPTATCEKFDSKNEPLKFQCISDKNICLNITARCNGTAECPRGEDEANCSDCRMDEFECKNKKCIRKEWRCDEQNDCGDKSDEIGCDNTTSVAGGQRGDNSCGVGMFDCNDGNCIYMELVCNGHNDCPNKMDESDACATSCLKSPCQQICEKSPHGPVCSCNDGYRLGGDGKSCFDINECKDLEPCAQKCENLLGSFRCSCFSDFMLKSDKLSCKSIGGPQHILYSSLNVIYDISSTTLSVLWSSNSSKIAGMDVNVRLNLLYFTVEDTSALYEMNLETKEVIYVTNIGNPQHIAVEWMTDNVYFFDHNTNPSIKVCHMKQKACTQIIPLKYRDVVKSLVIDSTNDKMFYSILHPSFSSSEAFIYSHNLDGSRSKIIVQGASHISGLAYDSNKKILYYSDLGTRSIWSLKYDGTDRKSIFPENVFITKPADLSFHEDHLMILNVGSKNVAHCQTYGNRECKSFEFNAYNAENLVIVQQSRQKEKVNNCLGHNCSLICIPAELGPKCICHGGVTESAGSCKDDMSNGVAVSPRFTSLSNMNSGTSSNHRTMVTIFSVLGIIIGLSLLGLSALYFHRKVFHLSKTFEVGMHFENPATSNIDSAKVKMFQRAQLTTTNHYNEIYVNDQEPDETSMVDDFSDFKTDKDTTKLIY